MKLRTKVLTLVEEIREQEHEVRRLRRSLEVNICPEKSSVLFSDAHSKIEGLKLLDSAASYLEEARAWIHQIGETKTLGPT